MSNKKLPQAIDWTVVPIVRCPKCRHPLSPRQGPRKPEVFCACNPYPPWRDGLAQMRGPQDDESPTPDAAAAMEKKVAA